jgi:hypothetical protein
MVLDRAGIVAVTADGSVTGLRSGSTFVTVNGFLKIPVTVRPPIRIIPERATLAASETREFVAHVSPNFDQTVTCPSIRMERGRWMPTGFIPRLSILPIG